MLLLAERSGGEIPHALRDDGELLSDEKNKPIGLVAKKFTPVRASKRQ